MSRISFTDALHEAEIQWANARLALIRAEKVAAAAGVDISDMDLPKSKPVPPRIRVAPPAPPTQPVPDYYDYGPRPSAVPPSPKRKPAPPLPIRKVEKRQ